MLTFHYDINDFNGSSEKLALIGAAPMDLITKRSKTFLTLEQVNWLTLYAKDIE